MPQSALRILRVNFHVTAHTNDRICTTCRRRRRRRRKTGAVVIRACASKYVYGIVPPAKEATCHLFRAPVFTFASSFIFHPPSVSIEHTRRSPIISTAGRVRAQKCLTTFSYRGCKIGRGYSASCASRGGQKGALVRICTSINPGEDSVLISVVLAHVFPNEFRVNNRAESLSVDINTRVVARTK